MSKEKENMSKTIPKNDNDTEDEVGTVGANRIEKEDLSLGSLENDYNKRRVRKLMDNGYTEEEAVKEVVETSDDNEVESEAILGIVADSIYQNADAPIREYIANAETACMRAVEEYGLDRPIIEILYDRSNNRFVIKDNGIGISTERMDEICGVVGRTDMLDTGEMSGMWGMGMYSWFGDKFAGKNGTARIVTHSRETDENYGVLFALGNKEATDMKMPDDVYGTEVSGVIKDTDDLDVRSTVKKYSRWSRVTVSYKELDEDGKEVYNEEWGSKTIDEDLDDHNLSLEIDNEAFRAVCHPDAGETTLLVSMPIKRNDYGYGKNKHDAPYHFNIRIKQEGGQIANGWAKGKIPVSAEKYAELKDSQKENYINKDWLNPEKAFFGYDYVVLPKPTTNRDSLKQSSSQRFMSWLGERFQTMFEEKVHDLFCDIKTKDDIRNLDSEELNTLKSARDKLGHGVSIRNGYDLDLTDGAINYLNILKRNVSLAKRGHSGISKKRHRYNRTIDTVISLASPDGDVYMGHRISEDKANVVWELGDNNQVVQVDSKKQDKYARELDWKNLHDIDLKNLEQYDELSDEDIEKYGRKDSRSSSSGGSGSSRKGKDVGEKTVNMSRKGARSGRLKMKAKNIKRLLEGNYDDIDETYHSRWEKMSTLVLFPTSHDETHTDNYNLTSYKNMYGIIAVASCTNEIYDYLKDVDGVMTKEEYRENRWTDIPVMTLDGDIRSVCEEFIEYDGDEEKQVISVGEEEYSNILQNDEKREEVLEHLETESEFDSDKETFVFLNATQIYNFFSESPFYETDEYRDALKYDVYEVNLGGSSMNYNYMFRKRKYVVGQKYFPDWDKSEYPAKVKKTYDGKYNGDSYYNPSTELKMWKKIHDMGLKPDDIEEFDSWVTESGDI
jgi:hypothetical protein